MRTCDNFLYKVLQGHALRARQTTRIGKGSQHGRGSQERRRRTEREGRRRGKDGRGHSPLAGGRLARCLSAVAHRHGPLPPRGLPRTRPLAVPAVTHPQWPRLQELARAVLPRREC